MKVAVLGATGMLGQHTARALRQRGHELLVLHRPSSNLDVLDGLEFEPRVADLEDQDGLVNALRGADGLVHAAAYYPTKPTPWQQEVEVAGAQIRRVLDAARAAQVSRITYVGAAIALKRRDDGQPGSETDSFEARPADHTPYLQVKYEMDRIAREYAGSGLPVSIAIPAMTFGEYDRGPTTGRLIVDIANRALPAYIHGKRNVIYAGDAGRGIALVLEQGKVGERYLLTGTDIEMSALVPLIARVAGVEAPTRVLPMSVARWISRSQTLRYRLFGGELPKLSSTAIAVIASGQYLRGEKARRELGFASTVSLEEAVQRALRWFIEVGYVQTADGMEHVQPASKSATAKP